MPPDALTLPTIAELERRRSAGLWSDGRARIKDETGALLFMKSVGFALRYNATPSLPLAAVFQAVREKRQAIELTNALLSRAEVVETNVIAGRLVLVHSSLVPAVYALRKRGRKAEVSSNAQRSLDLIVKAGHATAGDVRRYLNVAGLRRPDPADLALAELQTEMLIDRGPSSVPKQGLPYLSPEGFPYRSFKKAHPDLVRLSREINVTDAIRHVIETYLRAAVFVVPRKLATMFNLLFSESEMNVAIDELVRLKTAQRTGKYILM